MLNGKADENTPDSIRVTEEGVECTWNSGRNETILFADLSKVSIVSTSSGPFADDLFWQLETPSLSVLIPCSMEEDEQLLDKMQSLPGFDNRVFIQAMTCTEDKTFVCWESST